MIKQFKEFLSNFIPTEAARLFAPLILVAIIFAICVMTGLALVKKKKIKKNTFAFYMFISPWLIGFLVFTVYPVIFSFIISFFKWDIVSPKQFVGLSNYIRAFSGEDKWFYKSLQVTIQYTIFSVPLQLALGFGIALLINRKMRGVKVFRTLFYIPTLVSGVALSALWLHMFNYNFGLLNKTLNLFGITSQKWLTDANLVIPSFVLMSLWGIGGNMVICLAGLQDIPQDINEAAAIDGAGIWQKFKNITVPIMSPIIFFNLINGVIGSFQTFTQSYIMTEGGPNGASMFYVLNLYNQAFSNFRMGYGSALAWILFAIILLFTCCIFKSSSMWVYYETEIGNTKIKKKKGGKAK